jgi:hypothetical protein
MRCSQPVFQVSFQILFAPGDGGTALVNLFCWCFDLLNDGCLLLMGVYLNLTLLLDLAYSNRTTFEERLL